LNATIAVHSTDAVTTPPDVRSHHAPIRHLTIMNNTSPGNLFAEFTSPSRQEWLDLVNAELDGASFNDALVRHALEGFDIQPLYTGEDLEGLPHLDSLPGFPPFTRGSHTAGQTAGGWIIAQEIDQPDPREANARLLAGLGRGQTGVVLRVADATVVRNISSASGIRIHTVSDVAALLDGIHPGAVPLHVDGGQASTALYGVFQAQGSEALSGSLAYDPLGQWVENGGITGRAIGSMLKVASRLIRHAGAHCPDFKPLTISGAPYHNAGASISQELAFTLAAGVEYMTDLQEDGLDPARIARSMQWMFPVGTGFFFEIAKLRAARMLWAKIVRHFGVEEPSALRMAMRAESSRRSRTKFDPYVNMLRATLEVMAGALGGADAFTCAPFDSCLRPADDFSARLARNTQIVLQEESQLARVIDPAGGSYYIEHLTDSIGRAAWSQFQEIERRGGFIACFRSGWAQEQICETAAMRRDRLSKRHDVLIGTNQYPNLGESLAGYLRDDAPPPSRPASAPAAPATLASLEALASIVSSGGDWIDGMIEAFRNMVSVDDVLAVIHTSAPGSGETIPPLPRYRAAEPFERIRAAVERAPQQPAVFLAAFGPAAWRRARATFSAGLLGIAGFRIIDNAGFSDVADAAEAIRAAKPAIVVACSDDESYPTFMPALIDTLGDMEPRPVYLVAGNPKEHIETLIASGVDDFIHVRTDAGLFLAKLAMRLGADMDASDRD
jgi:methylmalonyl-CoA mutase